MMDRSGRLVALRADDGRQYAYRGYAPKDTLFAGLFREVRHCHDEPAPARVGGVRRGRDHRAAG